MHKFYIPVMAIGFSVDTPLKVAPFGISSAISVLDDDLLEKARELYCGIHNSPFQFIPRTEEDFRAKRITAYLNLLDKLVKQKVAKLKSSPFEKGSAIVKYFEMLPDDSKLKQVYYTMLRTDDTQHVHRLQNQLRQNILPGSIDVNIMTMIDKTNYKNGNKLSLEYNDAHAALRGFALSDLNSSVVLSAGINRNLYGYISTFGDFFPDEKGFCKKKIILKVSDYRSAVIQGKFLAKKGLWVSEYRIESGLNCGGHAFATTGLLIGPILEEFKKRKKELLCLTYEIYRKALKSKKHFLPDAPLDIRVTVQGGVGDAKEQNFLLHHYKVDAVGWGSPFLLVPEVTTVDDTTLQLLRDAGEQELYLSDTSPLGVPYNSLKGNTKDIEKGNFIKQGTPGSLCTKKLFVTNSEFTEKPLCTASRQYQSFKIKDLKKQNHKKEKYDTLYKKITDKSCICVGLGSSFLLANDLDTIVGEKSASVCPGPNLAYFSKIASLKDMVNHIYGRTNIITATDRPHMFIKELFMYLDYYKKNQKRAHENQTKYFKTFKDNLVKGIKYYKYIFVNVVDEPEAAEQIYKIDSGFTFNK